MLGKETRLCAQNFIIIAFALYGILASCELRKIKKNKRKTEHTKKIKKKKTKNGKRKIEKGNNKK